MNLRITLVALVSLGLASISALAQMGGGRMGGRMGNGGGRMVRGTVIETSSDQLTVKTDSGDIYQVMVQPTTRVRKEQDTLQVSDIQTGDVIAAMGAVDASNKIVNAVFISVTGQIGKTYIAGKVTAINGTKLTVLRQDNVSQVVQVDENTSFHRGGAMMGGQRGGPGAGADPGSGSGSLGPSITLADVKVGDMIAGPGALQDGIFVPTQLIVHGPAAQGGRNPNENGSGAGPTGITGEPK